MSAKRAADALMACDADTAEAVRMLFSAPATSSIPVSAKSALIRGIAGTWTLTLAAQAGGVSEAQVLTALARHYLNAGSRAACDALVSDALA